MIDLDDIIMTTNEVRRWWSPPGKDGGGPLDGSGLSSVRGKEGHRVEAEARGKERRKRSHLNFVREERGSAMAEDEVLVQRWRGSS